MVIRIGDFNYIRDLVRERSAIVLEPGKEYLVESRLGPLAQQEGFSSLVQMVDHLRSGSFGDLHRKVVEAMTTNETSFFREMRVFEMFRKAILPKLLAARRIQHSLHLWCAASSSGQEPYSVAMLLRECLPMIDAWNVTFIASDLSREILARARGPLQPTGSESRVAGTFTGEIFQERGARLGDQSADPGHGGIPRNQSH